MHCCPQVHFLAPRSSSHACLAVPVSLSLPQSWRGRAPPPDLGSKPFHFPRNSILSLWFCCRRWCPFEEPPNLGSEPFLSPQNSPQTLHLVLVPPQVVPFLEGEYTAAKPRLETFPFPPKQHIEHVVLLPQVVPFLEGEYIAAEFRGALEAKGAAEGELERVGPRLWYRVFIHSAYIL